ncbi:MAG: FMN-binding protein [Sedimentisphaerales bacterium]|nr:FMN-binding protein [Sedimentisphaerales bacterium]
MRSIKHFFEQSWLLIAASFFFGLLIAATNAALSDRIEMNKVTKLTNLAKGLLPQTEKFAPVKEKIEIKAFDGRPEVTAVYEAIADGNTVGWTFKATGSGFADKIELVVAVDKDFNTLAGFGVLMSNETVGFGDQIKESYFRNQFTGAPAATLSLVNTGNPEEIDDKIVAISGATVTSTAVVETINHYLAQIKEQFQKKGLIGNGNES